MKFGHLFRFKSWINNYEYIKQEDKELLLIDLCGRLPYGVKGMLCEDCICTLDKIWTKKGYELVVFAGDYYDVDCFKPYLFPLSSMTEEQRNELKSLLRPSVLKSLDEDNEDMGFPTLISANPSVIEIDYYNKNHIDYRGLIEKSLALDATNLGIYE